MKRELDHLAKFLHMAVDYAKEIGFKGQFYIEPKPKEPTKHQYDSRRRGVPELPARVRPAAALQAEPRDEPRDARRALRCSTRWKSPARRARSARSTRTRATCCSAGTPTNSRPTSISPRSACSSLLKYGGFTTGGVNFDAKVRRESYRAGGSFPRAHRRHGRLRARPEDRRRHPRGRAPRRVREAPLRLVGQRHRREHREGQVGVRGAGKHAMKLGEVTTNESGRQEFLENLINEFI